MAEIINNRTDSHLAYSRLRGPQLIRRGSWVATGNGRFGRCQCGGATLYGVCQQCSEWDHDRITNTRGGTDVPATPAT
jgi:hypothetical protein